MDRLGRLLFDLRIEQRQGFVIAVYAAKLICGLLCFVEIALTDVRLCKILQRSFLLRIRFQRFLEFGDRTSEVRRIVQKKVNA